jgi:MurNAc alpha-1-phosphate uridylyltransferase
MDALLLVVPLARAHNHGGQGDFLVDARGKITGRRKPGRVAPFVYTGVQILSPRVIRDWPEGPFSTNLFWDRAIEAGRAYAFVHQGLWFDVGTPPAIAKTEALLTDA